jgi:antitoxin (DNA-binding transcriptional repressor) of toxin-antitoxin stability system
MERISVAEAGLHFDDLIERVSREGVTVELERDKRVVARLSPAGRRVRAADLNRLFATFPTLGEDAQSFGEDVERIRTELPSEADPWA